uniref:hypothetical protein n=1 Tax=Enterococcus faecium TaxID=1352 RepID=UPI0039776C56
FTAMVMNYTGRIGTIILIIAMLFAAILLFELIGLINEKHQFIYVLFGADLKVIFLGRVIRNMIQIPIQIMVVYSFIKTLEARKVF